MATIGLATVVGNAAVLTALGRIRRAPAHYPLASLATADLLIGLFVLPLAAARELFVFHLNWALCSCWSALDVLCCTASILSLCTLGWERHSGITAPLARARRSKLARRYAVLVWPTAAIVALPTIFVPSPKHHVAGEVDRACVINTNVGYVVFSTFCSFYLPSVVMVVLYAKILTALASSPPIRAHRGRTPNMDQPINPKETLRHAEEIKKIQKVLNSPNTHHLTVPGSLENNSSPVKKSVATDYLLNRQKRATRTIVRLMSLFLVCWTPFFVMLPVDSVCDCVWESVWQWCTWLGYINSALNPVVYAAASPSVRRALPTFTISICQSRSDDIAMSRRA